MHFYLNFNEIHCDTELLDIIVSIAYHITKNTYKKKN